MQSDYCRSSAIVITDEIVEKAERFNMKHIKWKNIDYYNDLEVKPKAFYIFNLHI